MLLVHSTAPFAFAPDQGCNAKELIALVQWGPRTKSTAGGGLVGRRIAGSPTRLPENHGQKRDILGLPLR